MDFDKITRMDSGEFVYVIGLNLPSIKIDGKFEQNFYVKWAGEVGFESRVSTNSFSLIWREAPAIITVKDTKTLNFFNH